MKRKRSLSAVLLVLACAATATSAENVKFARTTYYIGDMRDGRGFVVKGNSLLYFEDGKYKVYDRYAAYIDAERYLRLEFGKKRLIVVDSIAVPFVYDVGDPGNNATIRYSPGFSYLRHNVKEISSNHFLEETIKGNAVRYLAENMTSNFFGDAVGDEYWNYGHLPFAVGGELVKDLAITVRFAKKTGSFALINGYVDLERRNLYSENSRIKTLVVKYRSGGSAYEEPFSLSDIVAFQWITLRAETSEIEISVTETYPGTKYSDLCISYLGVRFIPEDRDMTEYVLKSYEKEE